MRPFVHRWQAAGSSRGIAAQASAWLLGSFIADHYLAPVQQLRFAQINRVAGSCALRLHVTPGRTYRIEASPNLATWEQIAVISSQNGIADFTDVNAPAGQRFYRAVATP